MREKMTVAELIRVLQGLPQDSYVYSLTDDETPHGPDSDDFVYGVEEDGNGVYVMAQQGAAWDEVWKAIK